MIKKLRVTCSIGFPGANQEDELEIEITGEETKEELEKIVEKEAWGWGVQHVETWGVWVEEEEE